jgi:hypothetical protein
MACCSTKSPDTQFDDAVAPVTRAPAANGPGVPTRVEAAVDPVASTAAIDNPGLAGVVSAGRRLPHEVAAGP